jgi:membrane-bound lytic murein transglycosylase MltF
VMPATGAEMRVGDIRRVEPNIHAGTKYLARLMENYFEDAKFDEQNRSLFAFAAYNAGPANISKVRRRAAAEGVNPDVWFNQVEHVAARMLGQETVKYVRNVFKYNVAYKLAQQTETDRAEALDRLKSESTGSAQDDDEER